MYFYQLLTFNNIQIKYLLSQIFWNIEFKLTDLLHLIVPVCLLIKARRDNFETKPFYHDDEMKREVVTYIILFTLIQIWKYIFVWASFINKLYFGCEFNFLWKLFSLENPTNFVQIENTYHISGKKNCIHHFFHSREFCCILFPLIFIT